MLDAAVRLAAASLALAAGVQRSCHSRAAIQGCSASRCLRAPHSDRSQQPDKLARGGTSAFARACARTQTCACHHVSRHVSQP
eukprot:3255430-Alexandrium_andersonii.AAC.1